MLLLSRLVLGAHGTVEREFQACECMQVTERVRECACLPLLGSGYITLGLGKTRYSFKLTNLFQARLV